jgi:hypothetical protein
MKRVLAIALLIVSTFTVQLYALTCKSGEKHCEYEDNYKIVEWCCKPDTCQCQYIGGVAGCYNCGS